LHCVLQGKITQQAGTTASLEWDLEKKLMNPDPRSLTGRDVSTEEGTGQETGCAKELQRNPWSGVTTAWQGPLSQECEAHESM
jgi:hypothetical protein